MCQVPVKCIVEVTQTESVISERAKTHHLGLKAQNFENPIFTFGYFSLKAVYNSCKLQRLLQVAKFLFMYSFTHINIVFFKAPSEIVIFVVNVNVVNVVKIVNVCYQMNCFSSDSISFFRRGFANIPCTFLISCEVQTRYSKTLERSEQYIRDHLSGPKVSIWICSEYDSDQPNQVINFLFHIIFMIRVRL